MPDVVFLAGPAGTGKSTLADALADAWHGEHLDFDTVTQPIVDAYRRHQPHLSEADAIAATRMERYDALRAQICSAMVSTAPVIVSAPLRSQTASPERWGQWTSPIVAAGGHPVLVWLDLPEAIRRDRMATRGLERDALNLAGDHAGSAAPPWADRIADARRPVAELVHELRSLNRRNSDIF